MGRCPLLIPLAALVGIILISDFLGFGKPQEPLSFGTGRYVAYIISVKEASTAGQLAVASIDSVNGIAVSPFKTRIHFISEFPTIAVGQRVSFAGKLTPLSPTPDIPDVIDLQSGLRRQGITATVVVPADSIFYVASTGHIREWFASLNESALTKLKQCPINPESVSGLSAMLLGRSEMVDNNKRLIYSAAGLSHLLALSGMHVGIIAMMISTALWPLYLGRHTRTRLLLIIAALWFYAAFTSFIPSVTRAVIMVTVYMIGRILQRRSSSLNSLCLAAFVILLFTPEDLYSPGFQMSFSAVLGIILFYPLINQVNRRNHPVLYNIISVPALSLSAMSLTGIVAAFHFHSYPLYFIVANILVLPFVPLLLLSGVASMIFRANIATDFLTGVIDSIATFTASLPGAVISGLYPPSWLVILLLTLLCTLAWSISSRQKFLMLETLILLTGVCGCCLAYKVKSYPAYEEYIVEEYRSTQIIQVRGDSCIILTDAKAFAEREEIRERYTILLRDFVAKRGLQDPIVRGLAD